MTIVHILLIQFKPTTELAIIEEVSFSFILFVKTDGYPAMPSHAGFEQLMRTTRQRGIIHQVSNGGEE